MYTLHCILTFIIWPLNFFVCSATRKYEPVAFKQFWRNILIATRYIKYKRLSWLGHVERMSNERVAKTICKWKPYATRLKGRPRVRWEDDVRNDLRKMGVTNWKQRTQERKQWKEIIEQAKTHKEL